MSRSENKRQEGKLKPLEGLSGGQIEGYSMEVNEMLFKKWILNALRDDEVKEAIRQLTAESVASVDVKGPNGSVIELQRQLSLKDQDLKAAESEARKVAKKLESALRECEKSRERLAELEISREETRKRCEEAKEALRNARCELSRFQVFASLEKAYELYKGLLSSTRSSLDGIVNGKDLLTFACSGAQETNMERFWDRCSESYVDGDEDAERLGALFDCFFCLTQEMGTIGSLERLNIREGDRFDVDVCTRVARSAPTGNIRSVLMQGYRYKVSGKVVKKSLVRV